MSQGACVVVGVGPGNGAAFARRFVAEGRRVALLSRDEKRLAAIAAEAGDCLVVPCDVTRGESIRAAFERVERELGRVQTLIYNAGNFLPGTVDSTDGEMLEFCFRVNAVGCLSAVRRVAKGMRARGGGEIVVIGATASRRGAAGALPFAAAKAGQRAMVESMARELGPAGIHVAYVVIDAVVDMPLTRAFFADRPEELFAKPDDIAASVAHLVSQRRSAWTFELDLRPHIERW
jgi:NAD(P)-dependent dehydrogenase (short-subunit alcohol dehydrogenase family)